jgi:hypothetical protein
MNIDLNNCIIFSFVLFALASGETKRTKKVKAEIRQLADGRATALQFSY